MELVGGCIRGSLSLRVVSTKLRLGLSGMYDVGELLLRILVY